MELASGLKLPMDRISEICRRYYVKELAVFGSQARGDARPDSDVDVLVEFEEDAPIGLIAYAALMRELSEVLGRKVDLVETADSNASFETRSLRNHCLSMRTDRLYLVDILEASDTIIGYLEGLSKEQFLNDRTIGDAVLHRLMIAGEAAGNLSAPLNLKTAIGRFA